MNKISKLLILIFVSIVATNLFASEHPYTWVNYQGRKVKQWHISNAKYMKKSQIAVAKVKELAPKKKVRAISSKCSEQDNVILTSESEAPKSPLIQTTAFNFDLFYGITNLSATDKTNSTNATIYSDSHWGADLKWRFGVNCNV